MAFRDEFNGLLSRWEFLELGPNKAWDPSLPFSKDQGPWAYPRPEAAEIAGVHGRVTKPEHPYVYLDVENIVVLQESGTESDEAGEIPAGLTTISFFGTGKSDIYVDYNWDGKDGFGSRAVAAKTGTGKSGEAQR